MNERASNRTQTVSSTMPMCVCARSFVYRKFTALLLLVLLLLSTPIRSFQINAVHLRTVSASIAFMRPTVFLSIEILLTGYMRAVIAVRLHAYLCVCVCSTFVVRNWDFYCDFYMGFHPSHSPIHSFDSVSYSLLFFLFRFSQLQSSYYFI